MSSFERSDEQTFYLYTNMQFKEPIEKLVEKINNFLLKTSVDKLWKWREEQFKKCQEYKFNFVNEIAYDGRVDIVNNLTQLKPCIKEINSLYCEIFRLIKSIEEYHIEIMANDMNEPLMEQYITGIDTILGKTIEEITSNALQLNNDKEIIDNVILSCDYPITPTTPRIYTTNPKFANTNIYMYVENEENNLKFFLTELTLKINYITHAFNYLKHVGVILKSLNNYIRKNKYSANLSNEYMY